MSILATNYPDPENPGVPIPSACAWIYDLRPIFGTGSYYFTVYVHRSAEAAAVFPLVKTADQFTVSQGDVLADGSVMPTVPEIAAEAGAAQVATPGLDPFNAIRTVLYQRLMKHPRFAGTNPVQG